MLVGVGAALLAGMMWGLIFITPLMLPEYSGLLLSLGRYAAFGLIALIPGWLARQQLRQLRRAEWSAALKLAMIGNLVYYSALASAIQLADAPLPTMLIGTLPVVIAICSNWAPQPGKSRIAWRKLALPLAIIFAGILLVNFSELQQLDGQRSLRSYLAGGAMALLAVACWTWYPIMNARYLQVYTHISPTNWATVQGLMTLPLAMGGFVLYAAYARWQLPHATWLGGAHLGRYIGLMLTLGLLASWLGTLCWNIASQRLPTSLAGQLIVFETLSGLVYVFIWRGHWPGAAILCGAALLCLGVALSVRQFQQALH